MGGFHMASSAHGSISENPQKLTLCPFQFDVVRALLILKEDCFICIWLTGMFPAMWWTSDVLVAVPDIPYGGNLLVKNVLISPGERWGENVCVAPGERRDRNWCSSSCFSPVTGLFLFSGLIFRYMIMGCWTLECFTDVNGVLWWVQGDCDCWEIGYGGRVPWLYYCVLRNGFFGKTY